MARPFLLGVLAALAAEAAIAALVIWSGVVDVAATKTRAVPERLLAYASTRSIAHHASSESNPLRQDPAALKAGLEHYRDMCVACHGSPGAEPAEFAAGLHPSAPDLTSAQVQAFTDGMLYQVVAGGIGSTGMPAFGTTHRPEQIWSIVSFVRHLPALTPAERKELARGEPEHGEEAAPPAGLLAPRSAEGATHSGGPAGPEPRVHQVSISGFKFSPASVEARLGDVIEWKNADFVDHTATAADGAFDTGRIRAGETRRVVARSKGQFSYFCRYHAAMKGTLVVR